VAYQRAASINEKAPAAWQGLAELYDTTQQPAKAADAYQQLVSPAGGTCRAPPPPLALGQTCRPPLSPAPPLH
jgi:hypothetical protein